jgi:hypothetical protein
MIMRRAYVLPTGTTLDDEIARLRDLATLDARREWRRLTGKPAARGLKGDLLARSLVHVVQEKVIGALSPVWARRLATMAKEAETELARPSGKGQKTPVLTGRRQIKPGSRLVREWQGTLHEVVVVHDGYLWNTVVFTSLSSIAKEITGTSWNGWTFFGISQPRRAVPQPKLPAQGESEHMPSAVGEVAHG